MKNVKQKIDREFILPGDEGAWWITADPHFNHANIISYANRPFIDAERMNTAIIDEINAQVAPQDKLIIVGDFGFGNADVIANCRQRINCENIILVVGNHDFRWINMFQERDLFSSMCYELWLESHDWKMCLHHWPKTDTWFQDNPDSFLVHGHCHGTSGFRNWRIDVGVDYMKFKPVNLSEMLRVMRNRNVGVKPGELS